jgi:hypothetical protein
MENDVTNTRLDRPHFSAAADHFSFPLTSSSYIRCALLKTVHHDDALHSHSHATAPIQMCQDGSCVAQSCLSQ